MSRGRGPTDGATAPPERATVGYPPEGFHTDDSFYRIARPRDAVSLSLIFAVDPFTVALCAIPHPSPTSCAVP